MREISHALRDKSARRSLCLALAGTLGVGNIVGVAIGIIIGGEGSVFWIFVSGFFSSVIKYCECVLSASLKNDNGCGMYHTIERTFVHRGRLLGVIYAILCLILSLTMGSMIQANAVTSSVGESLKISPVICASVILILTLLAILVGSEKIDKFTGYIIPATTIVYIIIMSSVIFCNLSNLTGAVTKIISNAFNLRSAVGGFGASALSKALKEGFARGLLSNEAGAGTSALAQTRQDGEAWRVGLMGVLEVFFDTTILCTLTGIAIVSSSCNLSSFKTGTDLIYSAVRESIGGFFANIIPLAILLFAYSTVICWYYYGSQCVRYLTGKKHSLLFEGVFLSSVAFGSFLPVKSLVYFVDNILLLMSILTLITLKKNSERIVSLSEKGGLLK